MTDLPTVLFVCVHNAGRSRMAEAFFNRYAEGRYRGLSAGTQPASTPHPEVVVAMRDKGIDIEGREGTLLTGELAESAVHVIGMGCNVQEACPALRIPLEDWELEDPKGKPPDRVAAIRDDVERRVKELLKQLDQRP